MKTKKLTKRIVALIVSLLLIASIGCLVGCNNNSGSTNGKKLSATEFYGIGSVSTVQLLGSMQQGKSMKRFASNDANSNTLDTTDSANPTASADSTTEAVKAQALDFNKYFATLDNFLNEDNINVTAEENTSGEYADYAKKLNINCKDLSGATMQYTMYYNEVEDAAASQIDDTNDVNESNDVDDDDDNDSEVETDSDDDNDSDNDNDNETEKYYTLNGIMVVDGVEYKLMGRRQVETEADETENEIMIRAYLDEANGNYVEMKHEASVEEGENEVEYVYSLYQGGKLVEETAIEFENEVEDNETETEYTLEFRKGENKGVYTIEREVKGNETEIKVNFNMDGKTGYFNIKEVDDGNGNKSYEYKFEDNSTVTFDKD